MQTRYISIAYAAFLLLLSNGCGGGPDKKDPNFFTSGNREADQRASQRMAKAQQLNADQQPTGGSSTKTSEKLPLYERLGGETGVNKIVDDFVTRALADPRVNWQRKGITRGGLSIHRSQSMQWADTPANVKILKLHISQFIALATGGPSVYQGQDIKQSHAGLHISNPEFDASVGDLKATLDKFQIANPEQKELLSIIESTREQIVEER